MGKGYRQMLERLTKQQNRSVGTRCPADAMLRAVSDAANERRFTLSFSSEEPYERWFGLEILDHAEGAVELSRLTEIGCVLFNHDRGYVLGKVTKVWVEDNRGMAEVEFDDDEQADHIRGKVASGTLKGVSVGYSVDAWEEVAPGKTSADGKYAGPCSIARKWTPYEISIVSVPADATVGIGRSAEEEPEQGTEKCLPLEVAERQLRINKNMMEVVAE